MTVKQYLARAYHINERIQILQAEQAELLAAATGLSHTFNPARVQKSASAADNAFARYAAENERYKLLLANLLADLYRAKREVLETLSAMENPVYRELLTLRYVRFLKWEAIASHMHYDYNYVRGRLHGQALHAVRKQMAACKTD